MESLRPTSADKKVREMSDVLYLAIRSLVTSPETPSDFKCPLGIAIAELKRSQLKAESELQTLKTDNLRLESQVGILSKEKEQMIRELENSRDRFTKIDSLVRVSSSTKDEFSTKLSKFENNTKDGNYSEFVSRLASAVKSSIETSAKYESIYATGATKLSIEILDKINPLLEAARIRATNSAEDVRQQYQNTLDFITNNSECDPRIPMKFLKLAGSLSDMAKQAVSEGQEVQASAYLSSARELMNAVRSLYDNPELSRLLQIFRRR